MAALSIVSLCLVATSAIRAENWPQWRGPTNNCVSQETGIPAKFSKTENVAWRLPLPGQAGSTPIVWENRIFLTSAEGNDLVLMCCIDRRQASVEESCYHRQQGD